MSKPKLSPKKSRSSANAAEAAVLTTNEKILQDCYSLYVDEEKGWIKRPKPIKTVKWIDDPIICAVPSAC